MSDYRIWKSYLITNDKHLTKYTFFYYRWPNTGCCKYVDSINYERQLAKKLANQGLLKKKVPPPSCSLLDIFDGEYKPFMGTHNKQFPTVVLFWTPWSVLDSL